MDTHDPEEMIRVVTAIAPTFGGINLEDIKAPECFEIETRLEATLDIPVFHDDQHGTAIITAAGLLNGASKTEGKDKTKYMIDFMCNLFIRTYTFYTHVLFVHAVLSIIYFIAVKIN